MATTSLEQLRADFVANVSHEIRTPLTSVRGYAETLGQDAARGMPADPVFIDRILRNVDRIMSLVSDLLDLSHLESGVSLLEPEDVLTGEITRRVGERLAPALVAKGQSLAVSDEVGHLRADARRLEQVLQNLLENAYKYSPAGTRIEVRWAFEGESVLLQVLDSGAGIPAEHHARIFERFYRVDTGRSREVGGTGLGLAIVKHIMHRHGGEIWIENRPAGTGSMFVCRFRRGGPPSEACIAPSPPEDPAATEALAPG